MTELNLLIELAKAYNNMDNCFLESILSDGIVYESQDVFSALRCREEVMGYLKEKFHTVRNSVQPVFAEIGFLDNNSASGIFTPSEENRPCIILSQGTKENKIALVLVKISGDNIIRIDVCTVYPHWSEAIPTGCYPS